MNTVRTRLIERLNSEQRGRAERRLRDEEHVLDSVIGHVRKLLNTRRGNVPVDPGYGMPELARRTNDAGAPDSELIESVVREVLQRYEPRLADVAVRLLGRSENRLGLEVEIAGTVRHAARPLPLRLTATVTADGRFLF